MFHLIFWIIYWYWYKYGRVRYGCYTLNWANDQWEATVVRVPSLLMAIQIRHDWSVTGFSSHHVQRIIMRGRSIKSYDPIPFHMAQRENQLSSLSPLVLAERSSTTNWPSVQCDIFMASGGGILSGMEKIEVAVSSGFFPEIIRCGIFSQHLSAQLLLVSRPNVRHFLCVSSI